MTFGALTGVIGLGFATSDIESSSEIGALLVGSGLLLADGGVWVLKTPSRAERELFNVQSINDLNLREKTGHEVLISLAEKGEQGRILGGITSFIVAAATFFLRPHKTYEYYETRYGFGSREKDSSINDIEAVIFAALAFYQFAVKSPAEKALERYEAARQKGY